MPPPAYRPVPELRAPRPESAPARHGIIQRMRSTRSTAKKEKESAVFQQGGYSYLKLKAGTTLYHSSGGSLSGVTLNTPAYLTPRPGQSYGGKSSKTYSFTVQKETSLIVLNDLGNIRELLSRIGNNEQVRQALIIKVGAVFEDGEVVSFKGVKTASGTDQALDAWFKQMGEGWYVDSSKDGGLAYDEIMITDASCLGAGEVVEGV